ncbi:MAG: hypothetical protein WCS70_10480 [Verrucomicrobiota bacterium]
MNYPTKVLLAASLIVSLIFVPVSSQAWVACARGGYGGYTHAAYGGACWHAGYSCGGVSTGAAIAAGAVGFAAGATVVANSHPVYVQPVYTQPTYYVAPPPIYVAPPVVVTPYGTTGTIYNNLPAGAQTVFVNGTQYFVLNGTYFQPQFGNGLYYEVVPNPNS